MRLLMRFRPKNSAAPPITLTKGNQQEVGVAIEVAVELDGLAERIRAEMASRSGQLVTLALCTQLASHPDFAGVLYEPARREAEQLLDALSR